MTRQSRAARPIMVTGAGGLIGRTVVERLIALGRPVLAVDRAPPPDPADFEIVQVELEDAARLHELIECGTDAILHCGAISGPMVARDRPGDIVRVNVGGTLNLLEPARRYGVRRFVYCSSVSAYGDVAAELAPAREDAPLAPRDVYGASKAASDIVVRAYAREHGLDAVVLRIGSVYGPRRRTESMMHRFIRDALDGRPTVVEHDGNLSPAFVNVADVAGALIAATDASDVRGRAFNVIGAERATLIELAAMVKHLLPRAEICFTAGRAAPDYRYPAFDLSAAEHGLGWRPRIGLAEGISRYATWLTNHTY